MTRYAMIGQGGLSTFQHHALGHLVEHGKDIGVPFRPGDLSQVTIILIFLKQLLPAHYSAHNSPTLAERDCEGGIIGGHVDFCQVISGMGDGHITDLVSLCVWAPSCQPISTCACVSVRGVHGCER